MNKIAHSLETKLMVRLSLSEVVFPDYFNKMRVDTTFEVVEGNESLVFFNEPLYEIT